MQRGGGKSSNNTEACQTMATRGINWQKCERFIARSETIFFPSLSPKYFQGREILMATGKLPRGQDGKQRKFHATLPLVIFWSTVTTTVGELDRGHRDICCFIGCEKINSAIKFHLRYFRNYSIVALFNIIKLDIARYCKQRNKKF